MGTKGCVHLMDGYDVDGSMGLSSQWTGTFIFLKEERQTCPFGLTYESPKFYLYMTYNQHQSVMLRWLTFSK